MEWESFNTVSYTHLLHLSREEKIVAFERFVSSKIPCVVFTTMTEPDEDTLSLAMKYDVPVLVTHNTTSVFMEMCIRDRPSMVCLTVLD